MAITASFTSAPARIRTGSFAANARRASRTRLISWRFGCAENVHERFSNTTLSPFPARLMERTTRGTPSFWREVWGNARRPGLITCCTPRLPRLVRKSDDNRTLSRRGKDWLISLRTKFTITSSCSFFFFGYFFFGARHRSSRPKKSCVGAIAVRAEQYGPRHAGRSFSPLTKAERHAPFNTSAAHALVVPRA
jgi:hypothetical protein